jgi:hypothetical protein
MHMRIGLLCFAFVVVALLLGVGLQASAVAEPEGQAVTIDQVPAVVKAAIEKESLGGTVKEIEKTVVDGKTLYEVDIVKNKIETEVLIAEDGKVLKRTVQATEGKEDKEEEK